MGWIPAVYESTEDLVAAGQRIVYLTNPHVGHLGIFVSASVARHEHRAILKSLEAIEALPPGLYEMMLLGQGPTEGGDKQSIRVTFEPRRVEDIQSAYPRAEFERVRAVSELNETLYEQFVSPYVRAAASPWGAEWLKWVHPMRWTCYAWSERFQPWLSPLAAMADEVRSGRAVVLSDNMWRSLEHAMSGMMTGAFQATRSARDVFAEAAFLWLYGQPWLSVPTHQDNPAQCTGACCQ
ncbi:DUF3141 domain-containing protein [Cupriavidus basilensis]